MFELGEDLLDGVQVGRVFWQEDQLGSDGADKPAYGFSLVAAQIVHDDDVSRAKGWDKNLLDIGLKGFAIDRTIKKPWGVDPVMSQCGQEGRSLPVTVRDLTDLEPGLAREHLDLVAVLLDLDLVPGD